MSVAETFAKTHTGTILGSSGRVRPGLSLTTAGSYPKVWPIRVLETVPQRYSPPGRVASGASKNVATHPVAQLKQEDIPPAKPLQTAHRSLSPRTHPFHTTYDGDGKRVKKFVPSTGETTTFVYDNTGNQIAEYSSIVAVGGEAKVAYLTNDHLGTPRINTDQSGAVRSRHDYYPFGDETARLTHAEYTDDSIRRQFIGYEKDSETELDYAKARFFGSSLGRFTSPDDFMNDSYVQNPQTWNLYVYCRNNPLKLADPNGKKADVTIKIDEKTKTGTITIKASIGIWTGDKKITGEAMKKVEGQIKASIEKAWKGSVIKDGITYTVSTEVTVKTYESESAAFKDGAQNVIEMANQFESHTGEGGYFTSTDVGKWNINKMDTSTAAHEFGHLLGLENKPGYVLMNTEPARRHPTMTAEDFDWTFGSEVTNQRRESRMAYQDREGVYGPKTVRYDTGRERDSEKHYTFSHPRGLLWYDFKE